jgi:hypothetical protein
MTNPSKKLSPEGQGLVHDFRDVVEQTKYMLLTKNEGNLIQDFIWQTQQIDGGSAGVPNAPIDKETAQQHGNQVLEGLRTLGTLIITNGGYFPTNRRLSISTNTESQSRSIQKTLE